jgi:transglutaminase-like putative cysteine protease
MQVKIGCEMTYESSGGAPLILLVQPRAEYHYHKLLTEERRITPEIPVEEFTDLYGNRQWRMVTPPGSLTIYYDAIAEVSGVPDPQYPELQGSLVRDLPHELLHFLLSSRHCPHELVISEAWERFGNTPHGWARVQAVCDWLKGNVTYGKGSTTATTGYETYVARQGVCRDFAHMGVMLCRALSIPARYVCGYLPDIGVPPDPVPMDFHAWFEAYIGGEWHTFDARHNIPRTGRVLIGQGRDAVDVALATSYGDARLANIRVWADEYSS